jgi:speckle-type POZ protein
MSIHIEYSFNVIGKAGMNCFSSTIPYTFSNNDNISGFPYFVEKDKLESDFCINGLIHISCNMKIVRIPKELRMLCSGGLQEHIENLWTKGEEIDVTFEVEGKCIPAHKLILAARSSVFKAELFGHMEEADMDYIRIEDMKFEVFKALIHFIYTDKLRNDLHAGMPWTELLQDLFVAADRYALHKLKALCEQRLAENLCIDTVASTLVLADRHNSAWLKEKCFDFVSDRDNLVQLAFIDEYWQAMQAVPSLKHEWHEKVINLSSVRNRPPKKQRAD